MTQYVQVMMLSVNGLLIEERWQECIPTIKTALCVRKAAQMK